MEQGPRLTDDEAALVFRRASELDVDGGTRPEGWDVAALEEVGREVGISGEAIRRAIMELQLGVLGQGTIEVTATGPIVRCTRVVPGRPDVVRARLDGWLSDQLFEPVRDRLDSAVFAARQDRDAQRQLGRDKDKRFKLGGVDRVVRSVGPAILGADDATIVRLEAELRWRRGQRIWDRWTGGATRWGAVGAVVVVASPVTLIHAVIVAPVAGGALVVRSWRRTDRELATTRARVELALDGVLDRLETGRPLA